MYAEDPPSGGMDPDEELAAEVARAVQALQDRGVHVTAASEAHLEGPLQAHVPVLYTLWVDVLDTVDRHGQRLWTAIDAEAMGEDLGALYARLIRLPVEVQETVSWASVDQRSLPLWHYPLRGPLPKASSKAPPLSYQALVTVPRWEGCVAGSVHPHPPPPPTLSKARCNS